MQKRFAKLKQVLATAIETPADQRVDYIEKACAGDPELLVEVRAKLAHLDRDPSILKTHGLAGLIDVSDAPTNVEPARSGVGQGADLIGRTISHYRVQERLGAGGMGEVYRAEDRALGRMVALKVLKPGFETWVRQRMLREAWANARVQHPGIATFYEAGQADGVDFIVMEYVPGQTLRQKLKSGPLVPERAIEMVCWLLEALVHAHSSGILHRDIKPDNIVVTEHGWAKLLDFGLAKALLAQAAGGANTALAKPMTPSMPDRQLEDVAETQTNLAGTRASSSEDSDIEETLDGPLTDQVTRVAATLRLSTTSAGDEVLTQAGAVMGTLGYMPPEQLRGRAVDERSDVFSMGALLYETLAGRPAFPGQTAQERIAAVLSQDPPRLQGHGISKELDEIVRRAVARHPSDRYASASDFLTELRRVLKSDFIEALPNRIAILDFENISRSSDDTWIGSDIAESLTRKLEHVEGLNVVPREQVLRARGTLAGEEETVDATKLGLACGCRWMLTGAFESSGSALRVTMRLVDVATDVSRWSETLQGTRHDIFDMHDQLAAMTARSLKATIPDNAASSTTKLDAYELYARGQQLITQSRKGALEEAYQSFLSAIKVDPNFAPALASLARSHAPGRWSMTTDPADLETAIDYAQRAILADPDLAEGHTYLGYALWRQDRHQDASRALQRAMELSPANAIASYFAGICSLSMGRHAEAISFLQRAVHNDPHLAFCIVILGLAHMEYGQHMEARWALEKAVEMEKGPSKMPWVGAGAVLAELFRRSGSLAEARRCCMETLESVERSDHLFRDAYRTMCLCVLGRTALQQRDVGAAKSAYTQVVQQSRGRPRSAGVGHVLVQALAGLTRAGSGPAPLEEGLRVFEEPREHDFSWNALANDACTFLELARAADVLGRSTEAHTFLESARKAGSLEALAEDALSP